jgi:hypothetical protein
VKALATGAGFIGSTLAHPQFGVRGRVYNIGGGSRASVNG